MITIRVDQANRKLSASFAKLNKQQTCIAISRAINRSLTHGNAQFKKLIKKEYNIKNSDMNGAQIVKARSNYLSGDIRLSRKPIGLSHFNPRFDVQTAGSVKSLRVRSTKSGLVRSTVTRKGTAKKGVSIEIEKGKRIAIPYAFMIQGKNPVFARGKYENTGGKYSFLQRHKRVNSEGPDTPISRMVSTSIFGMSTNPQVDKEVKKDLTDFYSRRVSTEIANIISKM
jgi:hypothetical protein